MTQGGDIFAFIDSKLMNRFMHTARRLFGPNTESKNGFKKQHGEGEARGAPAPQTPHASGAHPHETSGTALEHALREPAPGVHPGRQHAVW